MKEPESHHPEAEGKKASLARGRFERLLQPTSIERALRRVVGNAGAPGPDGMTCGELERNFAALWPAVEDALRLGTFRFGPLRSVEIPKPDGGFRTLRIPSVMDRVVLQALAQELHPIWDPVLSDRSFAYRCGRGALEAVAAARESLGSGLGWVVHLDIVKCFDRLDIRHLRSRLRERLDDALLLDLLDRALDQGSSPCGLDPDPERPVGVAQGSPLSPLLANIALDPLDRFLESRDIQALRYADDVVLLCPDRDSAESALRLARGFLESELLLEVHREKTRISSPDEAEFLGFSFPCSAEGGVRPCASQASRNRIEAELLRIAKRRKGQPFPVVAKAIADRVNHWLAYYGAAGTFGEADRCRAAGRRVLRGWCWTNWGDAGRRRRELVKRGVSRKLVDRCLAEVEDAAAASGHPALAQALPNRIFADYGLADSRVSAPVPAVGPNKATSPNPVCPPQAAPLAPAQSQQFRRSPLHLHAELSLGRFVLRFDLDGRRVDAEMDDGNGKGGTR